MQHSSIVDLSQIVVSILVLVDLAFESKLSNSSFTVHAVSILVLVDLAFE